MGVELATLRHGTIEFRRDGMPYRWMSGDTLAAELRWESAARMAWASLMLPDGRRAVVRPRVDMHPIFGPCDELCLAGGDSLDEDAEPGPLLSRFAAVDWARPRRLPPLERPSALPAGAGTAVLNLIAMLARAGGVASLRYAGPYPTAALYTALHECFATAGGATDDDQLARFSDGVALRAFAGCMDEVDVDFSPAPFERAWHVGQDGAVVCSQRRDGVERVHLAGRAYERGGRSARRLVWRDDTWHCELWIAGAPWADLACLTAEGGLISGPRQLPGPASALVGKAFPAPLVTALIELTAARVPALLADAARTLAETTPIVWGDPGDDVACLRDGAVLVHAELADRMSGAPIAALAAELAAAITPVLARAAQAMLEARWMRGAGAEAPHR